MINDLTRMADIRMVANLEHVHLPDGADESSAMDILQVYFLEKMRQECLMAMRWVIYGHGYVEPKPTIYPTNINRQLNPYVFISNCAMS